MHAIIRSSIRRGHQCGCTRMHFYPQECGDGDYLILQRSKSPGTLCTSIPSRRRLTMPIFSHLLSTRLTVAAFIAVSWAKDSRVSSTSM